jgi:hypothetical protein
VDHKEPEDSPPSSRLPFNLQIVTRRKACSDISTLVEGEQRRFPNLPNLLDGHVQVW